MTDRLEVMFCDSSLPDGVRSRGAGWHHAPEGATPQQVTVALGLTRGDLLRRLGPRGKVKEFYVVQAPNTPTRLKGLASFRGRSFANNSETLTWANTAAQDYEELLSTGDAELVLCAASDLRVDRETLLRGLGLCVLVACACQAAPTALATSALRATFLGGLSHGAIEALCRRARDERDLPGQRQPYEGLAAALDGLAETVALQTGVNRASQVHWTLTRATRETCLALGRRELQRDGKASAFSGRDGEELMVRAFWYEVLATFTQLVRATLSLSRPCLAAAARHPSEWK